MCPVDIYLLKVNYRNTRTRCKICSKLIIKTPERRWRRSGIFIVNFEHFTLCSSVSTVNVEHVNADWVGKLGILGYYFNFLQVVKLQLALKTLSKQVLANVPICYPLKHQKILDFLVFSGGKKWEHWSEMGANVFASNR